jgi:hypothetical protein
LQKKHKILASEIRKNLLYVFIAQVVHKKRVRISLDGQDDADDGNEGWGYKI